MKQTLLVSFILIAVAFLAPLAASGSEPLIEMPGEAAASVPPPSGTPSLPDSDTALPSPARTALPGVSAAPSVPPMPEEYQSDADTTVTVLTGGQPVTMSLRDLLRGILTSEMPFSYPDEALKAQAVAARSFVLHCARYDKRHENADLCGDPSCCLAFTPLGELAAAWGEEGYAERVTALVDATDGLVLSYDGELCQTLFFAVSSGRTENAADVWGSAVPYLTSVSSVWDAGSAKYAALATFRAQEAKSLLLRAWPSMTLEGTPEQWFGEIKRSTAGGVLYMEIGGVSVSGTDIRAVFGLKSHIFTLSVSLDEIRFDTRGHGHGVGMSQYGAGEMALAGADFSQILTHYYKGAMLTYLDKKSETQNVV